MRISAIQGSRVFSTSPKAQYKKQIQNPAMCEIPEDTVSFKSNEIKKGIGIGALVGLAALSIISGGAATPLAYGVYAATMGTAGGMLGGAIKETEGDD